MIELSKNDQFATFKPIPLENDRNHVQVHVWAWFHDDFCKIASAFLKEFLQNNKEVEIS